MRYSLLAAAILVSGPALAQTATTKTAVTKPMAAHTTASRTVTTHTSTTMKTTAPGPGRMVTAKLANGKTVTYNCSLPGNANKAACK